MIWSLIHDSHLYSATTLVSMEKDSVFQSVSCEYIISCAIISYVWWWWGGGGGWREGSALEEGDCTPWSARGFLWLSKPCFQAGSMTVWQGSGHYCAGPLCTMPMGMRSHMLGVGECRHCGLGLKTAFIQQSVNCAHNRCLRRCISVWLVYHLDWILQSLTHISKGKGRDSCLGLW